MPKIKAIETNYKGYRFRSRLEARWAVFFDALRIRWIYEHEGFDLGEAGYYLPDFWLPLLPQWQRPHLEGLPPECGFWIEIKPTHPSDSELVRLRELSRRTKHCAYVLAGNVGLNEFEAWKMHPNIGKPFHIKQSSFFIYLHEITETNVWGGYRRECGHCGGDVYGSCQIDNCDGWCDLTEIDASREAVTAFQAARSARFEHGEMPE